MATDIAHDQAQVRTTREWNPNTLHVRIVYSRRSRPEGQPTRGKTAPNRLRRLDAFVCLHAPELLTRKRGIVVDLGFGRMPITTIEMANCFWRHNPNIHVVGIERDSERLAAAAPYTMAGLSFRRGGFNLPIQPNEPVRIIRAMNVLRQYTPEESWEAHNKLVSQLDEGGMLIEGSSDPFGQIIAVVILRKRNGQLASEGMVLSTNFRQGCHPSVFQPHLPRHLIQRMCSPEPIFQFFQEWRCAYDQTISTGSWGCRQHFVESCRLLSSRIPGVVDHQRLLRRGYLLWRRAPYP